MKLTGAELVRLADGVVGGPEITFQLAREIVASRLRDLGLGLESTKSGDSPAPDIANLKLAMSHARDALSALDLAVDALDPNLTIAKATTEMLNAQFGVGFSEREAVRG